ncbi:hypothetical protein [Streptomyces sp. ME18-1-4]|uniref:hypothetical protein n=1 Tax=Streptomyces sp. ME18-1-4 TaxID=3028685 RepID=UPI0029B1F9BC|nr:hypothetical protein [Streptomyces sp. ME18-1-4]MDX3243661.1 hypothetical protein [Streptomyces sp. ME18-1-4]
MSGYTNPYVLLQFPELGDDVSVLMKNPQLLPPSEITPEDVPTGEDGQPTDPQAANEAMYKVMARIILAWKVYEAFAPGDSLDIDPEADPADLFASLDGGAQTRLGKVTPENVARLPLAIINRVGEEIGRVADPR